ncbi:hypothetical protein L9F63_005686, partial [Diploptera punctata]
MTDDSTCVSEVTSAISRIRMQSNVINSSAVSSNNEQISTPQSASTPVRESSDAPITNSFRLKDIVPPPASSTNNTRFKIPIIGYEIMEERARFTVYKLRIENNSSGDCWFVFRRYTDFVRLFSKLKNDFPNIKLTLPRKRWFGDNFDPDFLEERIHGLQCFVNTILENPHLCASASVQDFFCLTEPPSYTESLEESRAIFETLEETIYHLRCQLKEKDLEINKLKACLTTEMKKKEKFSQLIKESPKECPNCGREILNLSSPSSDSSITLKEVIEDAS